VINIIRKIVLLCILCIPLILIIGCGSVPLANDVEQIVKEKMNTFENAEKVAVKFAMLHNKWVFPEYLFNMLTSERQNHFINYTNFNEIMLSWTRYYVCEYDENYERVCPKIFPKIMYDKVVVIDDGFAVVYYDVQPNLIGNSRIEVKLVFEDEDWKVDYFNNVPNTQMDLMNQNIKDNHADLAELLGIE